MSKPNGLDGNPSNRDLLACLLFGLAGASIGYGYHGTLTAAATGFGLGLITIPTAIILIHLFC